jgi:hypothetical protein
MNKPNLYWRLWLWWQDDVKSSWWRLCHTIKERTKSTWFSLKVGSWHKPCVECWGSGISVKYGQEQDCRLGCDRGYQKMKFWHDLNYSLNITYKLDLLKMKLHGCKRKPWRLDFECKHGTFGCSVHTEKKP